jgi:PAS domain-containing protein
VFGADVAALGLRADELIGKTVADFYGSDDPAIPAVAAFCGLVRQGRVAPLRDRAGDVVGTVGMSVDVTELEAAEAALRQSDALIRAVVESALDAISIMDPHGCIVEFNTAAEAVTYDIFASDPDDPVEQVTCTPASGSTFPLGRPQ